MVEDQSPEEKLEVVSITGIIKKDFVIMKGDEAKRLYEEGYYGMPDTSDSSQILLDPFEASLLAERSRLNIVTHEDVAYSPRAYIERNTLKYNHFWEKYLVYKDLRNRGYPVKGGPNKIIDFFVYPRGTKAEKQPAKFFIHIVNEAIPTTISQLYQANEYAQKNKRKLVLAISDRTGDVTYYEATSLEIRTKE